MRELIITERSNIVSIADAVRSRTGETQEITLSEMIDDIDNINDGGIPENVVTCDLEGATEDESTVPVNADTLGGELPDAFARSAAACGFCEVLPGTNTFTTTATDISVSLVHQNGNYFSVVDGAVVCEKSCMAAVSMQLYFSDFTSGDRVIIIVNCPSDPNLNMEFVHRITYTNPEYTASSGTFIMPFYAGESIRITVRNQNASRGRLNYITPQRISFKVLYDLPDKETITEEVSE